MEEKAKKTAEEKRKASESLETVDELLEHSEELGVDLGEAKVLADEAKKKIEDREWKEGAEIVEQAIEILRGAYSQRLEELIDGTKEIHELIDNEDKCQGSSEHIKKAGDLAKEDKFKEALDIAKEALDLSRLEIQDKIRDDITTVESLVMTLEDKGRDTSEVDELLSKTKELMDEGDLIEAVTIVNGCMEKLNTDISEYILERKETLEKLEKIVRESGGNTTDVEKMISKLSVQAKNADFDGAQDIMRQTQDLLDDSLEDVVESKFKEIKEAMDEAREIEADLEPVNSQVELAKKLQEEGHYSEAYNALEEGLEKLSEAKFHKVLQTIAESRENFIKAKEMGIEISEPMNLLSKARDDLKEGNHKGALEWARAGRNKVKELVKDYDETEARIEKSLNLIDELKELNIELKGASDLIVDAEASFSDRDYANAMAKLDEFDEYAEKAAYDKIMEMIEEFEMNLLTCENMGINVIEYSDNLEKAIAQVKSGLYPEAGRIAMENSGELREIIIEGIDERYDNLKDIIKKIKKEATPDEDLSDLEDLEKELKVIDESLDKGLYRDAHTIIKELSEKLESWQVGEADGVLSKAKDVLELAVKLDVDGIDVPHYQDMIKEAEEELTKEEYTSTINISTSIIEEINEQIRKISEEDFAKAKMEVVKAKKAGVSIEDMRKKLIECKKFIRDEDYHKSIKLSMSIQEEAAIQREKRKRSYEMISNISNELTRLRREEGLSEVGPAKHILLKAKDSFQNRDYSQAEKLAEQAVLKIKELEGKHNYEMESERLKDLISDAESIGVEHSEAEGILEENIRNANRGEYEVAAKNIKEAYDRLTDALEDYVKPELDKTRDIINSADEINIDVSEPKKKLKEAHSYWTNKEYKTAISKIEECRNDIEEIRNKSRKAASEVKRVKERIIEAKDLNANVSEAESILGKAIDSLKKDDYDTAISETLKAEKNISEAEKDRVERLLSTFETKISDIRRQGVNTALADNLLKRAEKAMEKGNYKESINLAMQSEGELERIELQQDISKRSISATNEKLVEAKERGIIVDEAEKLLRQARQAYQGGFYVKAFDSAIKSGDTLNKTTKSYESSKQLLELIKIAVEGAEYLGLDVEAGKEDLEAGNRAFERGRYTKALMSARQSEQKILSLKTKVSEAITETEELMVKLKGLNQDVGDSEELIKKAKLSSGMGEILESLASIKKAHEELGGEDLSEYTRYVDEVNNLLESAKKFGADVGETKTLLSEATSLESSDISKAKDKAFEALEAVEKVLEPNSPHIEVDVEGRLLPDGWSKLNITIKNIGNGVGRSLSLEFDGCEQKDFELQDMIKAGEEISCEVELKPLGDTVKIFGTVERVFDGKTIGDHVEVKPSESSFEIKKSSGNLKCLVCKGSIKEGLEMIECACGQTYHKPCGERAKECEKCGSSFSEKKVASKRVALKL